MDITQHESVNQALFSFIQNSPSSYHAVNTMKVQMREAGFIQLWEDQSWLLKPGGKYFVCRNASSLISFILPEDSPRSFHIMASHSDSPTYKIKPGPGITDDGKIVKLNVEKYGGPIHPSWFDRPLSVAGRVLVDDGSSLRQELVYLDRNLLMIPSLAAHLYKDMKDTRAINVQTEMAPIIAWNEEPDVFWRLLAEAVGVRKEQILGMDLFLCCREAPSLWGANNEFIAGPHLDDLACCYTGFLGLLHCCPSEDAAVHCVFDNEEVGSRSRQGADSTFLRDVLERICLCLGMSEEQRRETLFRSFLLSADNAHAQHPNYAYAADPINHPGLNRGIVLKHQAELRYATDAVTAAVFKKLCMRHDIPFQEYTNRSDQHGGSTLGSIACTQLPVPTVDIGLPQLGMHSVYECAGALDTARMACLAQAFFSEALPAVTVAGEA